MSDGDSPEVAAAIARLKSTLDTQAVMALVGLAAITGFLAFTTPHEGGPLGSLLELLPWFIGLSIVMYAANRWTLSLKSKSIRRHVAESVSSRRN